MGFLWSLALVATFVLGLAAGAVASKGRSPVQEVDQLQEKVNRLQQQVGTLQARLRVREESWQRGATAHESPGFSGIWPAERFAGAAITEDRMSLGRTARARDGAQPQADRASAQAGSRGTVAPPPTVDMALDRFFRYLEAANGSEGRERWQRMRELVDDFRAMGDVGAKALMQVLASRNDSEERRAAARLLGTLQVPQAVPLLRDIIEKEDDLLLRRAAASGLRQIQTPEAVPVMERMLANPGDDRLVRLNAAYGLAQSGRPQGVVGLTQIFEESTADGRGREMAFRALSSLNDERPLPFMRQVVTSQAEPSYRLQAIKYLTAQGDRQALTPCRW